MPRITSSTIAEHRQAVSHRLLDAFGALLAEHGYQQLSLRHVTARAEVARTAIYNYYRDKPDLLLAWMRREITRFDAVLREELADCEDPAERLRRFIVAVLTEFASRPLNAATNLAAALSPEQREAFLSQLDPIRLVLVDILSVGSRTGAFRVDDADSTTDMILACLETQRTPLAGGKDLARAIEQVLPFIQHGLAES